MPEFNYVDVPLRGINAARARSPRLQASAIAEFGEMLSDEVARGQWTIDNDNEPVNAKGASVEEYLNILVSTRPHWEIPATVVDDADETWLSGNLTRQAERWNKLRAFLGNDAATNAAMAAEAAQYGAKVGSTVPGVLPGTKPDASTNVKGASNPWDVRAWKQGEEARQAKMASIIRQGTRFAASMAASAGVSITGTPLKK